MQKNISRRKALQEGAQKILLSGVTLTVWSKPLITSVVLSAHAMTSICGEAEVLGPWRLEIFDYQEPNIRTITFLAGGTTDTSFIHEWSISSDDVFSMSQDLNDWRFAGTFSAGCTELSGTYTRLDIIDFTTHTGTWQATKL